MLIEFLICKYADFGGVLQGVLLSFVLTQKKVTKKKS